MTKSTPPNLWRVFALLWLLAAQGGCSLLQDKPDPLQFPHRFTHNTLWQAPIKQQDSEIEVRGQLSSTAKVHFIFQEKHSINDNAPPLRITLSDDNCIGYHQLTIEHWDTEKSIANIYPNTKITWNTDFTLRIHWQKNGQFRIQLNDDVLNLQVAPAFNQFRINTKRSTFELNHYHYQPTAKNQ